METRSGTLALAPEVGVAGTVGEVHSSGSTRGPLEARVRALMDVARTRRAPIAVDLLLTMLPSGRAWTSEDVQDCLAAHPAWGQMVDGYVHPGVPNPAIDLAARRARSDAMLAEAERAVAHPLGRAAELTRCIGVSGSVAYGLAESGDDLDFFVVVRRGGTWLFLLLAFLASRGAHRDGDGASPWCFNYVVEEGAIDDDLAEPRGLLVAREALSVRVIRGDPYYRQLLGRSRWIGAELPQMYRDRTCATEAPEPMPRLGWFARTVNVLVFPFVATYLQVVGLMGNRRWRTEGPSHCFATETTLHRFQLRTHHFDQLHRIYRSEAPTPGN
jgi:hypothetical protein